MVRSDNCLGCTADRRLLLGGTDVDRAAGTEVDDELDVFEEKTRGWASLIEIQEHPREEEEEGGGRVRAAARTKPRF